MTEICARCERNGELLNGLCHDCIIYYEMLFEYEDYMEQKELERQIEIMTDPKQWGGRRVLPLVRDRGGERDVGFLYVTTNPVRLMPTVWLGTCLRVVEWTKNKQIIVDEISHDEIMTLTSLTYPTFASIAYDGWRVDNG